jgi:hypothetical protein
MAKNDIKKCRYEGCKHKNGDIDIKNEKFILIGKGRYYHTDCKAPCKYRNCKHPNQEIDFAKDSYTFDDYGYCWHTDCKKESDTIVSIIDFWYRNIDDDDTSYANLHRIIRTIISRGYEAEYILFALKSKVKVLHHPPGLFYAVDDWKLKEEWKKKKIEDAVKGYKIEKPKENAEPKFQSKTIKASSFADIFGGDSK